MLPWGRKLTEALRPPPPDGASAPWREKRASSQIAKKKTSTKFGTCRKTHEQESSIKILRLLTNKVKLIN
jgi:hypothetical protein